MRILIKGGVWKNTEDEILKAAVMKYGKNAWARVASLLNRKSAKQCKARWYEWLDPSIKKTEWNKDEEEKLLHLAKLMPNQWRTIAPIVGRTAQQCMEHYEKLLSQAEEDSGEPSSSTDDPRRLRPGEIDPAPETKPARPDPIDMDEDEKEMLSEARARLANTKGKKAKRKIRERTMGEARRLAMLQKRRELKAAGIESKLGGGGNKKRKYIDYATEIPFQKVPPAGFYDVGEERQAGSKMGLDPTKQGVELAKLEGQHRRDDDEKNRKKDQRAMKKLYEENAPLAVARASAENDPATIRKRMPLALPAPQVSDNELEEIVKLGEHAMLPPTGGPGAGVTQALIGDYSQSHQPLPTPLRTPMQEDVIMQEAKNQRALREMTPLFDSGNSGELPELYEGTGFQGAMPKRADAPTPNTFRSVLPGATPSRALTAAGGATPLVGGSAAGSLAGGVSVRSSSQGGGLARATPLRDQFGLNVSADDGTDDNFSVSDMGSVAAASALMGTGAGGRSMAGSVVSSRAELARTKQIRKQLSQQLQSLPEPEFTYEVALPQDAATVEDVEDEEEDNMNDARRVGGTVSMVRDAAEVQQAALRLRQQREAEELERRSSVMKRGLPRPTLVPDLLAQPTLSTTAGYTQQLVAASAEVNREMVALMRHDDVQFPQQVSAEVRAAKLKMEAAYERAADLEVLPKDYIQQAQMLIRAEYTRNGGGARVSNSESDSGANGASKLDMESFNKAWDELHSKLMFIPDSKSLGGGTFAVPKNKKEALLALKTQFTALKARFEKYAKKAGKLENKLKVTTQGYQTRAEQLQQGFYTAYDLCSKTRIERECFASLHGQEQRAVARRISQLQAELKAAQEAESTAQQQYADIQGLCREFGIV